MLSFSNALFTYSQCYIKKLHYINWKKQTKLAFTCSKTTAEALELGVKHTQRTTPERHHSRCSGVLVTQLEHSLSS